MDVIASCFFSNFNSIQWSWRLEDIGAYYQAYSTIMNHWRTTLPSEILDVSYEQLIGNQEGVIRNMLTFCELDWSDACLDFYNNKRAVHTASRVQVRKPIYSTSIGRWKNYESQLATLQTFLNSHD